MVHYLDINPERLVMKTVPRSLKKLYPYVSVRRMLSFPLRIVLFFCFDRPVDAESAIPMLNIH